MRLGAPLGQGAQELREREEKQREGRSEENLGSTGA